MPLQPAKKDQNQVSTAELGLSIGGAGVFDGIYLVGIVSVLLA
jgi:uncharacterized membrane protein